MTIYFLNNNNKKQLVLIDKGNGRRYSGISYTPQNWPSIDRAIFININIVGQLLFLDT